jgi:hypothetical protein
MEQWGTTFTVAINGDHIASVFGAGRRTIFLIDKQGTVRAIAMAPLTSDAAQVDSTVKSIAGKIPALLATAIKQRRTTSHDATYTAAPSDNSKWASDLKGRKFDRGGAAKAPQMLIDCVRGAQTFLQRK